MTGQPAPLPLLLNRLCPASRTVWPPCFCPVDIQLQVGQTILALGMLCLSKPQYQTPTSHFHSIYSNTVPLTSTTPQGLVPSSKLMYLPLFAPSPPLRWFSVTVSADYLDYQLWNLPIHVTGVLSHSLVTTTLLKAVGVSAGPVGAVAAAAGIKWIIKVRQSVQIMFDLIGLWR